MDQRRPYTFVFEVPFKASFDFPFSTIKWTDSLYTFEYFLRFLLIKTPTKGIINTAFFVSTFSGQDQFQFFTLSYTDWASFPYKTSLKKTIFINIFGPLLQRKIIVNLKNKNLTIEN